uniref:hypothetical protein n=1 Tax=Xanthomonas oryzae TaxID=347 RepID=UPI003DA04004
MIVKSMRQSTILFRVRISLGDWRGRRGGMVAAAESQSRANLSGPLFEVAKYYNKMFGADDVMDNWRSAAGNQLCLMGMIIFNKICRWVY